MLPLPTMMDALEGHSADLPVGRLSHLLATSVSSALPVVSVSFQFPIGLSTVYVYVGFSTTMTEALIRRFLNSNRTIHITLPDNMIQSDSVIARCR